jgi:hypothetical protein
MLAVLSACGGSGGSGSTPTAVTAPTTTPAAQPGWVSVGPAPPAIEAPVAIDPVSQKTYVGSFGGGIFVTDASGNTVTAINNGL